MKSKIVKAIAVSALLSGVLQAAVVDVKIVNMTGGNYFTPLLVAAHPSTTSLFTNGMAASMALQKMAEGGDVSELKTDIESISAVVSENPAAGLLAPGQSTMTTLTTTMDNDSLSIVAMVLPTNDGFVALNNWKIPTEAGTYKIDLNVYDAGTEGNDEIINGAGAPGAAGIPADPSGKNGTGATAMTVEAEGFVHIHRGVLGDQDATGGSSDLNSSVHRWLNPVASVIVTVQ